MSDTPRTDVAEHNMGSIVEPHYVVDADFSRYLERELVEAREQLRLCNVDQLTTAAELAEAKKDAERYRLLRDHAQNTLIGVYEWVERDGRQQMAWLAGNELDDVIDAATKEGK